MFTEALLTGATRWSRAQVPTEESMDRQNVAYTYNGMSFSLKKEGCHDIGHNVDEP